MSTLRTMTRASVDQAEPLTFSADDREPIALATLVYRGVPVQVNVRALDSLTLADVEKRIGRLLERDGWAAPQAAPTSPPAAPGRARRSVAPDYATDGTPICPTHQKPLREGRYGLHCTAKDEQGKNGYCDLRFE